MVERTGGCQCGRVRYTLLSEQDDAYLCHCRMCQRAVGAVSVALTQVERSAVTWTTQEPERYRSSPFAQRGFCAACGTSLTYEADGEAAMDLTVGSFDDPGRFRPTTHYGIESWHPQWLDTRGLPTQSTDQNERIAGKWIETCGKLPD
jgi:hypothetical protein